MATRIQDLPAASQITTTDLFVIQQGGEAKSLTGEALTQYIAGHGGINSITLNDDYTLTFSMTDGEEITIGSIRGQNGEDGFSPSVTLTEGENGVNLTITDRLGPHTAFIPNGVDGFSPGVSFTPGEGGTNLVITDAEGSHTAFIPDGEDGFSPQVTLTPTAGGTNLVIVDATGTHTAFIANGEGSGDMQSAVYDPQGEVAAVGIPAYVEAHGTQNAVRYDEDQSLTDAQKAQARENINAAAPDGYYGNSGGTMQYATNFVGQLTPQNASNVVFRPTASNFSGSGWSADSISGQTATIEKIKGKTLVWNQLANIKASSVSKTENGVYFVDNRNGTYSVYTDEVGATASTTLDLLSKWNNPEIDMANHKFLQSGCPAGGAINTYWLGIGRTSSFSPDTGSGGIFGPYSGGYYWAIHIEEGTIIPQNKPLVFKPMLIDLTKMYGAGNEPTTVEEFRTMFPLDYYAYNPGELVSFNGTGLKTTGFNQLYPDGHIDVIAGLTYKIEGTYTSLKDSAGNNVPVTNGEFTPIANDTYTMVGGTCVHLKWSGVRDGETELHWDSELSLPIATYFEDGMKSVDDPLTPNSTVFDELQKDKYITRIATKVLTGADISEIQSVNEYGIANIAFYAYVWSIPTPKALVLGYERQSTVIANTSTSGWFFGGGTFYIREKTSVCGNTLSAIRTWLTNNPITVYYELAEPVETPINPPLNLTYRCDDFGTEMLLPQNDDEPVTAPLDMDVVYGLDYEANIRNMPANYANNNFVNALAAGLKNAGINMTADNDFGSWLVSIAYGGLPITTTAPTAANTDGGLKVAYLDTEPATKYDGWLYLIKE